MAIDLKPITDIAEEPLIAVCSALGVTCQHSNDCGLIARLYSEGKHVWCEGVIKRILPRSGTPSLQWGNEVYKTLKQLTQFPSIRKLTVGFNFPKKNWAENQFDTHEHWHNHNWVAVPRGWELLPDFSGLDAYLKYTVDKPEDIDLRIRMELHWNINLAGE